ncbi:MAG: hypothetical protein M3O02_08480 [Acidobacteriota bacterium]|nr:hypothetical protein [Acidobacteriota bacterium]
MFRTRRLATTLTAVPLLFALSILPAPAQDRRDQRDSNGQYQNNQNNGQYQRDNNGQDRRDNNQGNVQYNGNGGQYNSNNGQYNSNNGQYNGYGQRRRLPNNYSTGVRDGARGGEYDRGPNDTYRPGIDDRYHKPGGIGPGKGAAIGGAGGAILGAIFGGGLKGAVIGGAAGAGVGAVAGKVNQSHTRRNEY